MPQRSVVEAPNPLREGLRIKQSVEPCVMVIFGATGDLTHRKLLPALYNLALEHPLPAGFSIVGFARRHYSDEEFRQQALESINAYSRQKPVNLQVWDSFAAGIRYLQSDFHEPEGYERLNNLLNALDHERGTSGNRILYLSTPPSQYPEIIQRLGAAGLNKSRKGWTRIIIEKPFGHDLVSARELNRQVGRVFKEEQVYRIDHYLGKETVQNILVFRLANGIFEPVWNRRYVDNWRWAGVPFYLRTGKHLPKRVSEIAIQFKQAPLMLFKHSEAHGQVEPNVLTMRIQPDEGISLKFGAKVPGSEMQIRSVNMDFFYGSSFVREQPEAYERLLLDCMIGDSTLFTRRDEVEAAWTFIQGILDEWKIEPRETIQIYESGSWGPQAADEFIWRDGRRWRRP